MSRHTLTASPLVLGPMDLTVDSISTIPSPFTVGDSVSPACSVRNIGATETPAGTVCRVKFTVDGAATPSWWSDTFTDSILPGEATTLVANAGTNGSTWTAVSGSHTITALIDDLNTFGTLEPNKSNNSSTTTFTSQIATAPDAKLDDTAITFSPTSPAPGNTVTMTKTVKNVGNVLIDAGTVAFTVDGAAAGSAALPTIAAGAQANVSTTWSAVAGTHTVVATATGVSGTVASGGPAESPDRTDVTTLDVNITNARGVTFHMHNTDNSTGVGKAVTKVYKNDVAMGETANVAEIAYVNHTFWQKTASNVWYSLGNDDVTWSAGTSTSPLASTESADRTDVTTLDTPVITNARGVRFYIHNTDGTTGTGKATTKVYKNGTAMSETSDVVEIAYVNHVFWQKNTANNWYSLGNDDVTWSGATTTSPLA